MARLPMPMEVVDLRFTGNMALAFTVKWASDDPFAAMIDHIRVRFMMTNLFDVGAPVDHTVKDEMESWGDVQMLVSPGNNQSAADTENVPNGWDGDLGTLHRIDYRSPKIIAPDAIKGTVADIHAEEFGGVGRIIMDTSFQQRFVRLIAQARTAD